MSEHLCVVCPQLRPGEPRVYDRAQVCEGCRARLRAMLTEVVDLHAEVELEKGSGGGAKVSGSRTPPLPLATKPLDLTMPPHVGSVHDDNGDQVGDVSAATVLDSWARDWQSHAWSTLPEPTVAALVAWLQDRLEWACDQHPAVDDFAAELRELVAKLRPAAPRAEFKVGVPCRACDRVTLFRMPGSDRIECGSCPALMTVVDYERWTQLIAAPEHRSWVREVVGGQRTSLLRGP